MTALDNVGFFLQLWSCLAKKQSSQQKNFVLRRRSFVPFPLFSPRWQLEFLNAWESASTGKKLSRFRAYGKSIDHHSLGRLRCTDEGKGHEVQSVRRDKDPSCRLPIKPGLTSPRIMTLMLGTTDHHGTNMPRSRTIEGYATSLVPKESRSEGG